MAGVDFGALRIGGRYTRPELARLWGFSGFEALARGVVTPAGSNLIILFVTRIKQADHTAYEDFISGDLVFWEGEALHRSDDRIILAGARGHDIHLLYREIHHAPFEYFGRLVLEKFERRVMRPSRFCFRLADLGQGDGADFGEVLPAEVLALQGTERESVVRARVGHGVFRRELLGYWRGCSVSGLELPRILRAAHIKPWRVASNAERLDHFNGLLLLPQYDSLFDRGLVTFDATGRIVLSRALRRYSPGDLGIKDGARLRKIEKRHQSYLTYHRENVFVA